MSQFAIEKLPGTKESSTRLNPALPGLPHTILSVARTRGGKTTTCVQMYSNRKFPYRASFGNGKRVFLLSPTHHVQEELWDRLLIPIQQRFDDYSEDVFQLIIKKAESDPNRPRLPRLIIMDDVVASLPSSRQNNLIRILVYGRHLNISCSCLVQRWSSGLSHTSKCNFTSFFVWPQNRSEEDSIYKQVAGDIPRDLFRRMCKHAWSSKYQFLNIDCTQDEADGKYGVSFLKKFRVIRNDGDSFTERDPAEEQGRETKKASSTRHPWQHRYNLEKGLPAGKYPSLRSKLSGPGQAAQSGRHVL
jgi:hypothetical protein